RRLADAVINASLTSLKNSVAALSDDVAQVGKAFATRVPRTFLVNGARAKVAELPLPAGSYFVIAKAIVRNFDHDSRWSCLLQTGDVPPGFLDLSQADTEAAFGLQNFTIFHGTVLMTSLVTVGDQGSVHMECVSGEASSFLDEIRIIAIS